MEVQKTKYQPIVGIRGDMGAGKDTLALEICRAHPGYEIRKFATILRDAVYIVTGIPANKTQSAEDKAVDLSETGYEPADLLVNLGAAILHVTGKEPKTGIPEAMFRILTGAIIVFAPPKPCCIRVTIRMTVGRLLQVLGTECFRKLISQTVWVDAFFRRWDEDGRPSIVIADVRFPEESDAVRRSGGVTVLVLRAAALRTDGRHTRHDSERALDDEKPDLAIDNDNSISDLGCAFEKHWPRLGKLAAARAIGVPDRTIVVENAAVHASVEQARLFENLLESNAQLERWFRTFKELELEHSREGT
jgi:hypothetical protein